MIVNVKWPANDNVLSKVRPLTADDLGIILEDNALVLAAALDSAAKCPELLSNPFKAVSIVISNMPELQRSIAWRGSWLKEDEIGKLQEGGSLIVACMEVIQATIGEYLPGSIQEFVAYKLRPFSSYLREAKS